jgi:filamentous hemagglutinin family protein
MKSTIGKTSVSTSWGMALLAGGVVSLIPAKAIAQVVRDTTLPTNSTVTPGCLNCIIDGGTQRGANLFHSFSQFDVQAGGSASFTNPSGVSNIFSRVTGGISSKIDGTLGVSGPANLFFINPSGISFGPYSRLDLGGSFVASTASSILFPNGQQFSAVNPGVISLLTVDNAVPIGLQFEGSVANLQVQGAALEVNPGQNLSLIGGSILIRDGKLGALNGRIDIAAFAESSKAEQYYPLGSPILFSENLGEDIKRSDISIDNTQIDVSGNGKGSITMTSQNINLSKSNLFAGIQSNMTDGANGGGHIFLNATSQVTLNQKTGIVNEIDSESQGNAGSIKIQSGSSFLSDSSTLSTSSKGRGNAGDVSIIAPEITLRNKSNIITNLEQGGEGRAGNINIATNGLLLQDSSVLSSRSQGDGNGGDIDITAGEVMIKDLPFGQFDPSNPHSGIATALEPGGNGNAGNIKIRASSLTLKNGTALVSSTASVGNSGNISINADGFVSFESGSVIFNNVEPNGRGKSGGIDINAKSLMISDGAEFQTSLNSASGDRIAAIGVGGDVNIHVKNDFTIKHSNNPGSAYTAIFTQANSGTKGNSGNVNITAKKVSLLDGGKIFSNNYSKGRSGNISITASEIDLQNKSEIVTNLESNGEGNAGNIIIKTNSFLLQDSSVLSSRSQGKGNGGDIDITAGEVMIKDLPFGQFDPSNPHSGIATALEPGGNGNAGNIKIRASSLTLKNGTALVSSTASVGNSGNISIQASGEVLFESGSVVFNNVEPGGNGESGGIDITAGSLLISGGSELQTVLREPFGSKPGGIGRGGDVNINVKDKFTILHSNNPTNTFTAIYTESNPGTIGNAGNIKIDANTISLLDGGQFFSRTRGIGNAGDVEVIAKQINIKNQSFITSEVGLKGSGNGGNIKIQTDNLILSENSGIKNNTSGNGKAGNVLIDASNSASFQSSDILSNVESSGKGKGGEITINTQKISIINGAQLKAETSGHAPAGNIIVNSPTVNISGTDNSGKKSSGLFTGTSSKATGGNITINAENFNISDYAVLNSRTQNDGTGGQITVNTANFTADSGGQLITTTSGSQQAGAIFINATQNLILNGSITPLAGNQDNVEVTIDQKEMVHSGLFATTEKSSQGNGGGIFINSNLTSKQNISPIEDLFIKDKARISVDSRGAGTGGDIKVNSKRVYLNDGAITSSTSFSNGGDIELKIKNLLFMENGSQISTNAGTAGGATAKGIGGNILINRNTLEDGKTLVPIEKDKKQGFIVARPHQNNDITANSLLNKGGKVEISVHGLFGLVLRKRIDLESWWKTNHPGEPLKLNPSGLPTNDITAISEIDAALNGTVAVSTSIDPNQSLNRSLQEPRSTEVTDSCQVSNGRESVQFFDIGRGGLPPRPEDPLSVDLLEWGMAGSIPSHPSSIVNWTPKQPIVTTALRLVPPCQSR